MKRLLIVTAAAAALGAGWIALPPGNVLAQAPAPAPGRGIGPPAATNLFIVTGTPETKMTPGKAVLWTREQQNTAKSHIQWAPQYRLTATTRNPLPPATPPAPAPTQPPVGEMHTENTQVYLVTGGTGTVLVEGTVDAKNDYLVAQGEHRGGPIVGGRELKVKVGDLVSIPPYTWHSAWGDPGTPLQYLIIHVHTPQGAP
ncbi:MAG TPA: cupin domain-containing protein [Vicinamibacterales bacterium]|nr:cupin domain-containing protein [Vicinamibacterales bacterium]